MSAFACRIDSLIHSSLRRREEEKEEISALLTVFLVVLDVAEIKKQERESAGETLCKS